MTSKKQRASSITMGAILKIGRQSLFDLSSTGERSESTIFEFQTQHAGWLTMKPFYWTYLRIWSKAYFIIKDMFLIWYRKKPKLNFGLKPSGFIPLQGCKILPEGADGNGFVFRIVHDLFGGQDLVLRTATGSEASTWEKMLSMCTKISNENTRLGKALLLGTETKEQEKEKIQSVEQARKKALEAEELHEERQRIMEEQLKQRRANKKLLQKNIKLMKTSMLDMSFVRREIVSKHEQVTEEEQKFKELKANFDQAKLATEELKELVIQYDGEGKEGILENIEKIGDMLKEVRVADVTKADTL